MPIHYAHSLADQPVTNWHKLEDHLRGTSARAEQFAGSFAPGWGRISGLWHDAGKYLAAFQRRIGADPDAHVSAVDHAVVGALIAQARKAAPLAFAIAGHHGGLPNKQDLLSRLARKSTLLNEAQRNGLPSEIEQISLPVPPSWRSRDERRVALWTRFLFSALVDADFLDTEAFYEQAERELPAPDLRALLGRLEAHVSKLQESAGQSAVNAMRSRVLDACRTAATWNPGAFTLTVPTGGGKTLSSLSFALRHAVDKGLRRVIVVIPFTSILEQTAARYREALGDAAVIEHHSNLDPDRETRFNRLASENWDAPVVVTTSVQFFESLYANRTSRCRKVHRIARSVVVFDEVQTFPAKLLEPIRDVLEQLITDYKTTIVLCTATQPALRLPGTREIVADVPGEFAAVATRCRIEMPADPEPETWEQIAARLQRHEQVLAIVNRRDDAEMLAQLTGEDCIHLSARMCAAHRTCALDEIRTRLQSNLPCRVVSTQLIEAGVDVDFPAVYRAFAGADSLAQAAGRCNREGKRREGRLRVFVAPTEPPRGFLRAAKAQAEIMWREGNLDLTNPQTFRDYFARLYNVVEQDPGVLAAERELRFEESARLFRMIEEKGQAIIAPYGDAAERVAQLRRSGVTRMALRRLQPYVVNLYLQEVNQLSSAGAIEQLDAGLWTVVHGFAHVYDSRFGFRWQGPVAAAPEELIA